MNPLIETFPWLETGSWNPGEFLGGILGSAAASASGKVAGLFGDSKTGPVSSDPVSKIMPAGSPVLMIGLGLGLALLVILIISLKK